VREEGGIEEGEKVRAARLMAPEMAQMVAEPGREL
jgi:hypothetical protein